jgi:AcrR family transcriptional regulator
MPIPIQVTRGLTPQGKPSSFARTAVRRPASRGGTLGSTRRPPDQARTSILAAAERLFYDQGIGAVGVDAVADAAGVTKRTLYYHFESKDDLVAAYLDARDEATLEALRNTTGDRGTRPGDRVLGVFEFVERWAATSAYRGCPFNNAMAEQSVSPKVAAIARRHKATVRSWFEQRAAEGGAARPVEVGARLVVVLDGALNGAVVFRSPEPATVARGIAELVLDAAGVARTKRGATRGGKR